MSHGRILLVSHNFPPTAGPESHLTRMNAAFLQRNGFDVCVLTTTAAHLNQPLDKSLLLELPPDIEVERVASPEAEFAARYPRLGKAAAIWAGRNLLPEEFFPWAFPATKRGSDLIKSWRPDMIYSRATKHVSNVVGWKLKRLSGLPWVAHFSDPWIRSGLYKKPVQRALGSMWERRILRDADALVFVTRQAAERVLGGLPEDYWERVHIIPHGFEALPESLLTGSVCPPSDAPRRLRMIHAGAFYPNMRGPETLIEAVRRLRARHSPAELPEIECIGVDTVCFQPLVDAAGVGDVLRLQPSVAYEECRRRIAASDAILILDTPGSGGIFLPTKLIEAFAFKKPVLGLSDPGSAVASILGEVGQRWADSSDPEAIARELEQMMAVWKSCERGLSGEQEAKLDQFRIDRVNVPLVEIFKRQVVNRLPREIE